MVQHEESNVVETLVFLNMKYLSIQPKVIKILEPLAFQALNEHTGTHFETIDASNNCSS